MKKLFCILFGAVLGFSLAACGDSGTKGSGQEGVAGTVSDRGYDEETEDSSIQNDTVNEDGAVSDGEENSQVLVAYFSLAGEQYEVGVIEKGNTQIVAEMVAEQTGADVFSIESTSDYPDTYDGLLEISREEQSNPPQIAGTVENMDDYNVVFIGFPIWWGDLPPIIEVFLESYDFSGKTVIPFCTHAGSGLSGTQSRIQEICPDADVKDGLAVRGKTAQNDADAVKNEVEEWLDGFQELDLSFLLDTTELSGKGGEDMALYDFSDFTNVEMTGTEISDMSDEQLGILYQQARYCQAMTDADIDTMRELVSEDMIFTHMSGRQQTREEYFADVESGNLRYFTIGIDSPAVAVDGDGASITYTSVLNANAYGARGTYRMGGTHWYEKRENGWIQVNAPACSEWKLQ